MKLIIIGAGPGGYETALEAAKRGIEVVLVESGSVGGTCLNEGCIPTKTLCRSAQMLQDIRSAAQYGISISNPYMLNESLPETYGALNEQMCGTSDAISEPLCGTPDAGSATPSSGGSPAGQNGIPYEVETPSSGGSPAGQSSVSSVEETAGNVDIGMDIRRVMERKRSVVEQLRGGVESLLKNKLITLVRGRAELTGTNSIRVQLEAGIAEYSADYIIVATGSSPASLPIEGADLPGVLNSTQLLDIDYVPERLCIIGAGVIGLEFASIFNSFGSSVTVLEYCKQILPRFDSDLAKRLKQSLSKSGIAIETQAAVQSISKSDDGFLVQYDDQTKVARGGSAVGKDVEADCVLMAVGRRPNVTGLGLECAGVEFTGKGILTDGYMGTNIPSIYAIGDVNGRCMLAHAATYQGLKALNHICGLEDRIDLSVIPSAVFTMPEAATVGLTEEDCEQKGIEYRCLKSFFRANGKALTQGETDGFVKLIVAAPASAAGLATATGGTSSAEASARGVEAALPAGRILGCHLFGPHASDLIAEITALIHCNATLDDLKSTIHTHPTLSEVFHALA